MNVLFDTNVVLDVLLAREPHAEPAGMLFTLVDTGRISGLIGSTTVTTIHYLAAKSFGRSKARKQVHELLALFGVAPVDHNVLDRALELDFADFEDAVVYEAARAAGADAIVTRDRHGFEGAALPVLAPSELLAAIAAQDGR